MLDTTAASVSVGAYRAQPMTTDQIDAHPDKDRIWATIAQVRDDLSEAAEHDIAEIKDEAFQDGKDSVNEVDSDTVCSRLEDAISLIDADDKAEAIRSIRLAMTLL